MSKPFIKRYPILMVIILAILVSFFAAAATIVSAVFEFSETQTMLAQTAGFAVSILLALLIMAKSPYSFKEYGLNLKQFTSPTKFLWFAPIFIAEFSTFLAGFKRELTPAYVAIVTLLMVIAVINEETYFRGLMLQTLRIKGVKIAIFITAILFGLVHLGSLTTGSTLGHVLLLVAFSMLFGFVSAEIAVLTQSILVPIIWHFVHNMIATLTAEASPELTTIIVGVQSIILLGYAIFLWQKLKSLDSPQSND